jgi:MFS transporter, DHA1 family, multidrug resistance protein
LAMAPFSQNAGSAAALMGGIQMGISALVSALVSSMFNGTALPMVIGMAICALSGLVIVAIYHFSKTDANQS